MTTDPPAAKSPAAEPFGARLRRAMDGRGPLCVGIDPHPALLAGWDLPDDPAGLERFTFTVVEALADRVAVLKPQSAFFERFGSRGLEVLERAVARARQAGALVLADVKRGDIGSTMAAYADAYLDPGAPLFCDAITVSPYLGFGSLRPALEKAGEHGCGIFVLALTSNPEGAGVQRAATPGGGTVAAEVLDRLRERNAAELGADGGAVGGMDGSTHGGADAARRCSGPRPLGSFGAVVGATLDGLAEAGIDLAIGGPLLAPGIGAQGAAPAGLPAVFGAALPDVLPSVSRDVLRHGPSPTALRGAADALTDAVREVLDTPPGGRR